jgi:pimeloyl-ACP methyl ester carboxylesterase
MPGHEGDDQVRFVLVHGGFHGAWCWERVIPELQRLGHAAVAIDLPGHGERRHETAPTTFEGRTGAIVEVVQPGDVLVGHSGGGFDITHAADAVPEQISHVCFLAAGLPREGRTWPEAMAMRADGTMGDFDAAGLLGYLAFHQDGSMSVADAGAAREKFFHDCDDDTVQWAFERLCAERGGETSATPVSVPNFWAADLPRSFIRCLGDRAQERWYADLVAERLGVNQLEIDSSHSPFLSRPAELAELLVEATTTKPTGPLNPG